MICKKKERQYRTTKGEKRHTRRSKKGLEYYHQTFKRFYAAHKENKSRPLSAQMTFSSLQTSV